MNQGLIMQIDEHLFISDKILLYVYATVLSVKIVT